MKQVELMHLFDQDSSKLIARLLASLGRQVKTKNLAIVVTGIPHMDFIFEDPMHDHLVMINLEPPVTALQALISREDLMPKFFDLELTQLSIELNAESKSVKSPSHKSRISTLNNKNLTIQRFVRNPRDRLTISHHY